jgi:hypothetical protein
MKSAYNTSTNQRGAVLLLSLMLLALVMFSTLSLSTILVTELRSARFSDNSIVAHYAAESGSEQALFLLKEARSVDELGSGNPYSQLFSAVKSHRVDSYPGSSDLDRRYEFTKISTTSDTFLAYNIPLNNSVQLDVFDPLQEQSAAPTTNVNNIHIGWQVNTSSQTSNKLEVTVLSYVYNGSSIEIEQVPGSNNPRKFYYVCNSGSTTTCATQDLTLPPNRFYHLTIRPIDGDIQKVSISADDGTQPTGIPSQIFIKTTGRFKDSSQEVTVQTPWDNSTSDIFNYVIFSDVSLIKNILDSSSAAFPSLCGYCINNSAFACSSSADCVSFGGTCHANTPPLVCNLYDNGASPGESDDVNNLSQNNNGLCNARCSGYTFCGDGTLQNPNGTGKAGLNGNGDEQCDDGNISNTDACTNSCINTVCGDGYINQPNASGFTEVCDEKFACDATHTSPNCKSNSVIGACKTDCSGRVVAGGPPCKKNCPPPPTGP